MNSIKIVSNQHCGAANAKKIGFRISSGKYIYYMDSDDWVDHSIIDKSIRILNTRDVDAVFFGYYIHKGDAVTECTLGFDEREYDKSEYLNYLYSSNLSAIRFNWAQWSYIVKREILEDIINTTYEDIRKSEDLQVTWKCLLRMNSIFFINEPLYHYRFHEDSTGHGRYPYVLSDLNKVMVDLVNYTEEVGYGNSEVKKQLRRLFFDLVQGSMVFMGERQDFFLFPYELIEKGSRIIIYGAGMVGRSYYRQIRVNNYCSITGMCDKNYDYYFSDVLVSPPSIIEKTEFDYILIANVHLRESQKIKNWLMEEYHVEEEKLVVSMPRRLSVFVDID